MMQIVTPGALSSIPAPVVEALQRLIRRARGVLAVRGLCATAAVFLASLLIVMGVDAAAAQFRWSTVVFASWPRWAMTASSWAATVLAAAWFLVRPLARSFTLAGVARMIEQRHPELHERLSSVVELLTSPDAPELRGSDMLIAALAREAVLDAGTLQPRREVSAAAVRPFLITVGTILGTLGLMFALWPAKTATLLARAVAPHLNIGMDFDLVVEPGDKTVGEGDSVRVEVEVKNHIVDRAELRRWTPGGDQVIEMVALPRDGEAWPRFAVNLRSSAENFRYRVHAGSQTSRYYNITVAPRPIIRRIDVRYEYPAYTGKGVEVRHGVDGEIRAVTGTRITVTAVSNTPLNSAELKLDGKTTPIDRATLNEMDGGTACVFSFVLQPKMKCQWGLHLTSYVGGEVFHSPSNMPMHSVEAVSDAEPTAKILSPETQRLKLKPNDRLPLTYAVGDDFGLSRVDLMVQVGDKPSVALPLAIPAGGPKGGKLLVGKTTLDLAALKPGKANQLTFQLRSLDTLPKDFMPGISGPQQGLSELYTVTLDQKAASYNEQMRMAEEVILREKVQAALKELREAKVESEPLRRTLEKLADRDANSAKAHHQSTAEAMEDAQLPRADKIVKKVGSADAIVQELIPLISGDSFATIVERLSTASSSHMVPAVSYASQIKIADTIAERARLSTKTDFHVTTAIGILEDVLRQADAVMATSHRAEELKDLAERQNELAESRAGMTPDAKGADTEAEKEWKKSEKELAKDLAEIMKKNPSALNAALKNEQKETRDLAADARTLAREQQKAVEDAYRAGQMERLDAEAQRLAAEQADLARQTKEQKVPDADKPMSQAAEDLKASNLGQAAKEQRQAETDLKTAEKKSQNDATETHKADELARRAADMARQQKELADRAAAALKDNPSQLPYMKDQQKQLAQQVAQLAKEAGKANQAAQDAMKQNDPSGKMQEAAAALAEAKVSNPADAAKKAEQAEKIAAEAAKTAEAARKTADVNNTPEAQKVASETAQAAQARKKEAESARAAAQQAKPQPNEQAHKAAQAAKDAAEKAEQMAKALQKAGENPHLQDMAVNKARELAQRQADIRQRTENLNQQRQALIEQQKAHDMERLKSEQNDIARKAAEMVDKVKAKAPQNDGLETLAAASAQKAAEDLKKYNMSQAAKDATDAAEKLAKLAERMDKGENGEKADSDKGDKNTGEKSAGEKASGEKAAGEKNAGEKASGEKAAGEKNAGEQDNKPDGQKGKSEGEKNAGEKSAGEKAAGEKNAGEKASGEKAAGEKNAGEQDNKPDGQKGKSEGEKNAGEKSAGEKASGEKTGGEKPSGGKSSPKVEGSTAQEPDQIAQRQPAGEAQKQAELAEEAGKLAKRQDELAKQMAAMTRGDLTAALAQRQEELARKTEDLKKDVDMIREHAEELIPDSSARQEAAAAGNELNQAAQAQQRAEQSLGQKHAEQAVPNQSQATQNLHNSAAALDRLGQALAQAAANKNATPDPVDQNMAQALDATDEAAVSGKASDAEKAAEMLQALAQAAADAADAAAEDPGSDAGKSDGEKGKGKGKKGKGDKDGQKGQAAENSGKKPGEKPSRAKDSKVGAGVMKAELDPIALEKMGITLQDWARLPGKLRDQVLQAAGDDAPGEYRELVKRYFQEIAKRGGARSAEKK